MADRGTEVQFLEAAHAKLQDYILTMRSGLGKKIATQGLQRLEKKLEQLRSKEHNVAHKEFDPEAITDQKRAWLEAQELARGEQQLASWPQHLIDHFFVVGLPPDIEVTQIAGDLLEKERRQRDSELHYKGGSTEASATALKDSKVHNDEWSAHHDSIRMLRGGAASPSTAHLQQQQQQQQQQHHFQQRFDKVPAPAYPPQILYRYPNGSPAPIRDREVCDLCFPHQVPPRRIRRSPSWSALDEVVFGRSTVNKNDQAFVFMLKAGGNLPLYGICMYSEEVLHRPPVLARERYSNCKAPYRQCLIAAPRCYCILSQYPFFPLHFQVLNIILSMERLHRIVEFSAEVSHNGSGTLHRPAIPTTAADSTDKDLEVGSPTERLALGDHSPLHKTFAPDQMAERAPSVTSQEKWQQHCSDTMRQLAQRILDPQLLAEVQANPAKEVSSRASSMSRPSPGSLASRSSRPAEVWEGLAHMLGIGVKPPEAPEFTNSSAKAVRIDAPLVKPPLPRMSHHHHHHHRHKSIERVSLQGTQEQQELQQQEQEQQSQRVSLVQQMLEEALMATAKKDEQVVEQRESQPRHSGGANASVPGHAAPTAPIDMGPPGSSAFHWLPQGRASRKHTRLLGARSLDYDCRPSNLLRRPTCFSHQEVAAQVDKGHLPRGLTQPTCPCGTTSVGAAIDTGTQLEGSTSSPCSSFTTTLQAQVSAAMDTGRFLHPSSMEGCSRQAEEEGCHSYDGSECVSHSLPTSTNTHLLKNSTTTTPLKHLDQNCRHHSSRVSSHGHSMVAHASANEGSTGASADADQSKSHSRDCSQSGVRQVQQLPRSSSHTRTLGFGADQSEASVHSDGSVVAIDAVNHAGASQLPPHPGPAGVLRPLGIPGSDELPWDASTTPVRAFKGDAYERHLRALLAQQTSPSATQESPHQHLRELLNRHLASPTANKAPACVSAGVYDSCTSAKEAGCLGDDSSCNSSTCFATPELKVPRAWERRRSDGCLGGENFLYHQSVCTYSELPQDQLQQQQESSHHHQSASGHPGGHPNSSSHPLPHPPPVRLSNSSTCRSMQGLGEAGEMRDTANTPHSLCHQHSHSSTGSLPIFATPSAASSSDAVGGNSCSLGQLSSPARPAFPKRSPVRGALTKRLQQASPHHSASSTPLAAKGVIKGQQLQRVSKPARPCPQDVLTALQQRHQHTQSDTSFHTAVEGCEEEVEGVVEGASREARGPWVDVWEQLGEQGGENLSSNAAHEDKQALSGSISLSQQQQQQQPLEVGENGCPVRGDSVSLYHFPRVDTPPVLPSLPHRLSGSGCSESSATSSDALDKMSQRKGRGGMVEGKAAMSGLDASQFSSLAVLDTLYNAPLVHPGDCLHFSLGGINTLAYWRPLLPRRAHILGPLHQLASYADEELAIELSGWAAAALIRALPLEDLLMLLSAALLEQQLVFFCPNISMLSACVLGLLPLLRPYAWHGLLMPITPSSMACFLEAPVPFVLGCQYKTHDVSTRCTSLVRVNVYKGNISNASHLPALPGQKKLAAALAPHHACVRTAGAAAGESSRPVHVLTPEEEQATKSFLDVLSSHLGGCTSSSGCTNSESDACLLGDLRPYFITNVSGNTRTATLMKDWVIEGTPSRDRPFVRAFLETQMFQVHSDRIMASMCEGRVV